MEFREFLEVIHKIKDNNFSSKDFDYYNHIHPEIFISYNNGIMKINLNSFSQKRR